MLFDKPQALQSVGLERNGDTFFGVQLSAARGMPVLDQVYEGLTRGDEMKGVTDQLIVTSLSSEEVLVRPLQMQLKKEKDIDDVLDFQAEPLLPYPLEQAILDRMVVAKERETTRLTLFAVRKDHLQQHLGQWRGLGIDPEVVSCDPAVLALFSRHFIETKQPHFLVHVSSGQTACTLVIEDKPIAVQTSHGGVDSIVAAAAEDGVDSSALASLDLATVTQESHPHLYQALDQWYLEVTRLLYALSKQNRDQEVSEFLLTGEGASLLNLDTLLAQHAKKQKLTLSPPPSFESLSASKLQRLAVPIGAALTGLTLAASPVNFRQKEYLYTDPWKRLKKPLMLFGACSLLLAVVIYLFGQSYLGWQENHLRTSYATLLQSMNKPYKSFEEEYYRKQRLVSPEGGAGVHPLNDLSIDDIESRLSYLQKDLQDSPDIFPLLPNVPRVSDVLAWLSKHPQIEGSGSEGGLKIESFNYSMVSRPDLKKKGEKYKVKVEIEFSSPTPKLAREFHDALVAPNELVDPKGEVKWNSNRGTYRASFFLKDKTSYPIPVQTEGDHV